MTFAAEQLRHMEGIEEIGTSIMTPDGLVETPEVVSQCRDTHDQALQTI